jgi:hypothetical protein
MTEFVALLSSSDVQPEARKLLPLIVSDHGHAAVDANILPILVDMVKSPDADKQGPAVVALLNLTIPVVSPKVATACASIMPLLRSLTQSAEYIISRYAEMLLSKLPAS